MIRTSLLLVLAAILSTSLSACDDSGEKDNECEQAAALEQQTGDEYCADKTAECCYCKCWAQSSGFHDIEAYLADQSCVCVDQPADTDSEAEAACEGALLEEAQACLADEEACMQPILQAMEVVCQGSPL